ncbi:MAG: hypothetical protein Q7U97_16065, partial [Rhodocyclaceae bacterium]|nr:hypothetical protein [Rhodocyclaceae bacterium]
IRKMAGDVLDLSLLMTTWPVPAALNLGADLQRRLFGLCSRSGIALCDAQHCLTPAGAADSAACDVLGADRQSPNEE